jgi:hypothetical protein
MFTPQKCTSHQIFILFKVTDHTFFEDQWLHHFVKTDDHIILWRPMFNKKKQVISHQMITPQKCTSYISPNYFLIVTDHSCFWRPMTKLFSEDQWPHHFVKTNAYVYYTEMYISPDFYPFQSDWPHLFLKTNDHTLLKTNDHTILWRLMTT